MKFMCGHENFMCGHVCVCVVSSSGVQTLASKAIRRTIEPGDPLSGCLMVLSGNWLDHNKARKVLGWKHVLNFTGTSAWDPGQCPGMLSL